MGESNTFLAFKGTDSHTCIHTSALCLSPTHTLTHHPNNISFENGREKGVMKKTATHLWGLGCSPQECSQSKQKAPVMSGSCLIGMCNEVQTQNRITYALWSARRRVRCLGTEGCRPLSSALQVRAYSVPRRCSYHLKLDMSTCHFKTP